MKNWNRVITLATCCGICLAMVPSASADFVGVTTVIKDDPDTEFLCTEANGVNVPGPLTVCNVYAVFDDPDNVLLSVGNADLQVFNGANPDVFFQHPFNFNGSTSPDCDFIPVFPDLICDSFVTIGFKCGPPPPEEDGTYPDGDFQAGEFQSNGHVVGGWFDLYPSEGQGVAGNYPDLQVLFLQSSVLVGLGLSGDIDIFWRVSYPGGDIFAEVDVPIECVAIGGCQSPEDCDDGDACTDDGCDSDTGCTHEDVDCDDDIPCTEDSCDSGSGCVNIPNDALCDDDVRCTVDVCSAASGCGNTPDNANCDDGNSCTTDTCDADVGCLNQNVDCDDGNECTDDGCDPDIGCVHLPNDNECDDGDACTENDQCGEDGCVHGTPVQCPTGQVCDPAIGECVDECPQDLDNDGIVGASDLAIVLGSWGPCEGCPTDFNGDGVVDAFDLAQVLGAWGLCR